MKQRLLSVLVPAIAEERARAILAEARPLATWAEPAQDEQVMIHGLMFVSDTEALVRELEQRLADIEDLRIVLLPVEASVPHPHRVEEPPPEPPPGPAAETPTAPISIEELYDDVATGMDVTWRFVLTVILSALVAAIGVVRDDVAIIIGSMVIAPLLQPNMALSLATALGDLKLLLRAVRVNAVGLVVGLVTAAPFGLLGEFDLSVSAVAGRTHIGFMDLALATAAGIAGAMAVTSGTLTAVVGVMIAVALIPVLAVLGMTLGAGLWEQALGAALLLVANVICINLAGVLVFVAQRIGPRAAFEQARARRAVWSALGLWSLLLFLLVVAILLSTYWRKPL